VRYALFVSDEARDQLRALPAEIRRNIGYRLQLLQDDLQGDVKKLEGQRTHYRLRVGSYRVLFASKAVKSKCTPSSNGKALMSDVAQGTKEPTIREIMAELARLKERVEDLEDARELDAAIRRNSDKPLIPWEQVKQDLDL
jgi:mRNA-degrading endonuclease RelE of RelBE toxin-antitoxin system